jgi:hypothetical protein
MDYYLEFGKSTGLSGAELVQFAKDSVSLDRENRLAEREALHSQRLLDLEFQEREAKLKQDAEKLKLESLEHEAKLKQDAEKLKLESLEHEAKLKQDAEKLKLESLEQAEKLKLESLEQAEKLRLESLEQEVRLKQETEKLRFESHDRETKSKLLLMEKEHELKIAEMRFRAETEVRTDSGVARLATESLSGTGNNFRNLNIGFFDNQPESLDGFISRFETICRAYRVEPEIWGVEFSRCLTGPSLEVYNFLDSEGKLCYDTIISSLKKRWGITAGSYRKQFRTSKPYKLERLSDFVLRLQSYLRFWLEKSGLPSTYEGLTELIVSQQFFQSLDKNNQVFIKEQGRLSLKEMIEKAQNYSDAHQAHESQFVQFDKRNVHHDKNRYQNQAKSRDGSGTQAISGKMDNPQSREQYGFFQQRKEVDNSQSREQNRFFLAEERVYSQV